VVMAPPSSPSSLLHMRREWGVTSLHRAPGGVVGGILALFAGAAYLLAGIFGWVGRFPSLTQVETFAHPLLTHPPLISKTMYQ
jgi:hypothetical protein